VNKNRPTLRLLLLPLIAALALAATGCGEKTEPTTPDDVRPDKINLMLDWTPNANHAGIYTGMADGSFTNRALVVDPKIPADGAGVIQQVEAGHVDLGITYPSYLLQARAKGAKVKAIAALVNKPLNSLIWLKKSGIKNIEGLEGKTVAVSGDDNSSTLNTILVSHHVEPKSVKQVNVGYKLQQILVAGKADASITGYWNVEGVTLKAAGLKPVITPVDKAGSPTYPELVIIANENNLEDGRRVETYRRFIGGLQEGTKNAVENPQTAFDAIEKKFPDFGSTARDEKLNMASLRVTLPVLAQTNIGDNPFGWLDPDTWDNYAEWMFEHGELPSNATGFDKAITNSLLPGEVPGAGVAETSDDDTGSVNR
jgi:putative hydroxymethylpyrimidine transport system substrate-binding protein